MQNTLYNNVFVKTRYDLKWQGKVADGRFHVTLHFSQVFYKTAFSAEQKEKVRFSLKNAAGKKFGEFLVNNFFKFPIGKPKTLEA